jgi:hypothetical protein
LGRVDLVALPAVGLTGFPLTSLWGIEDLTRGVGTDL